MNIHPASLGITYGQHDESLSHCLQTATEHRKTRKYRDIGVFNQYVAFITSSFCLQLRKALIFLYFLVFHLSVAVCRHVLGICCSILSNLATFWFFHLSRFSSYITIHLKDELLQIIDLDISWSSFNLKPVLVFLFYVV